MSLITDFLHKISVGQLPKVSRDNVQIPYIETTPLPINTAQTRSIVLHHIPQKTFSEKEDIDIDLRHIPEDSYPETCVRMKLNYDKFKRLPMLNMISPEMQQSKPEVSDTLAQIKPVDAKSLIPPLKKSFLSLRPQKESFNNNSSKHGSARLESYKASPNDIEKYNYLEVLKARTEAILYYLSNNKYYSKYKRNWDLLRKNLQKRKLDFELLEESDADIAYVIDKGKEIKFKIKDNLQYLPLNVFQYVLYHELAHMSTNEIQHTPGFFNLLNIIVLAAFENGFINFEKYPRALYTSGGKPILSKDTMKDEVINGAQLISECWPEKKDHYDKLIRYIELK
jgi:hypothetical protein